jgi:hypothetical protein
MVHGGHDGPGVGIVDMAVRVGDLKGGGKHGPPGGAAGKDHSELVLGLAKLEIQ